MNPLPTCPCPSSLQVLPGLDAAAIAVGVEVPDWRSAIRAAGALLTSRGIAEPRYTDAMIATAEELGPYIVIAPGLAMPHSRPEHGALRSGMALVTLRAPVEFGNPANDPVQVVLALAAADSTQHLTVLAELAPALQQFFTSPDGLQPLVTATDPQQVLDLLTAALQAAHTERSLA